MKKLSLLLLLMVSVAVFMGCGRQKPVSTSFDPAARIKAAGVANAAIPAAVYAGDAVQRQPVPDQTGDKPSVSKIVYLTFDDGPDALHTPQVLSILDKYGIKATFFVIGTSIEKNPGLLREIVARGHAIGNHTYSHKYREIYAGEYSFLNSIIKNEGVIYKAVYLKPKVVRDPGGKIRFNVKQKKLLKDNGFNLVDWDIDSTDSRSPYLSAAAVQASVRSQLAQKSNARQVVVLMHDGLRRSNSVLALPGIIEMLKKQGYQFEVLR